MTFAEHILAFISNLNLPLALPPDVAVMNPFTDAQTMKICETFYNKFYADTHDRWMIMGINPGRHGGGITGIPFTDPIRLQDVCDIKNNWPKKQELSSVLIYEMIHAFGGAPDFYKKFYITSVSPLGFTKHLKNMNYYDDKGLQESLKPFVVDWLNKQLMFGINRNALFCLGDGKNFKYLQQLNTELGIFDRVIPLSHPRFIMQYKLKTKEHYIQYYLDQFRKYGTIFS